MSNIILPQRPPQENLIQHTFDKYGNDIKDGVVPSSVGDKSRLPQSGRGYKFDGVDDYISIQDKSVCAISNSLSFNIAFEIASTQTHSSGFVIAGKFWHNENVVNADYYLKYRKDTNELQFLIFYDGGGSLSFKIPFSNVGGINSLIYFSAYYFNDSLKIYINNYEITEESYFSFDGVGNPRVITSGSGSRITLGGKTSSEVEYFDGYIYDFLVDTLNEIPRDFYTRFYNQTLKLSEIHFKCEDTGLIAFDSSGNGNHGTKVNTDVLGANTFSYTGSDVPKSYLNDVGYTFQKAEFFSENINNYVTFGTTLDNNLTNANDYRFKIRFKYRSNSSNVTYLLGFLGSGTRRAWMSVGLDGILYFVNSTEAEINIMTDAPLIEGQEYVIEIEALSGVLGINTISNGLSWIVNPGSPLGTASAGFGVVLGTTSGNNNTPSINADIYELEIEHSGGQLFRAKAENDWKDEFGNYNGYFYKGRYFPRDETNPTLDVVGNPLQYKGQVSYPAKLVESNCLSFDGVDDIISFTDLTGVSIVSYGGTSTLSINGNNIEGTAGTVYNLLLSDGTHLPCAEGEGNTVYDASGNNNHGTFINGVSWTKQNIYHYNFENIHYRQERKFDFSYDTIFGLYGNSTFVNTFLGNATWRIRVRAKCPLPKLDMIGGAEQILQNTSGSLRRWTLNLKNTYFSGKYLYFYDLLTDTALRSSQEIGEDFFEIEIIGNGTTPSVTVNGVSMISVTVSEASAGMNSTTEFKIGGVGLNVGAGSQTFAGEIDYVKAYNSSDVLIADFVYNKNTELIEDQTNTYTLTKNQIGLIRTPINTIINNALEPIKVFASQRNHNGAETKVDFNPYDAPALSELNVPYAIDDDYRNQLNQFKRDNSDILFYKEDLTGSKLDRAKNYTKEI